MRYFTPEEAERVANSLQAITCAAFHDGPCVKFWASYFWAGFRQSLKFYIPLQFLPLLLRWRQLRKEPRKLLWNALRAALRSTMMLSGMVGLAKVLDCSALFFFPKIYRGFTIVLVASIVVLATLIESQAKVSEMSLYVLPRFLDAFWNFLKRRNIVPTIPGGKVLMFSLATSVLTYCYEKEPENLRGYYTSIMRALLGTN